MTVRDVVEKQSPDGIVLGVSDLRKLVGVGVETSRTGLSADISGSQAEVLLVGHDLRNDFKAMEQDGIKLGDSLTYSGCVDTYIIAEDDDSTRRGLSDLMEHYGLAECHTVQTKRIGAKRVFIGAHNAGNDAIATLKVLVAQALDMSIGRTTEVDESLYDEALPRINKNLILLAYDTETVESANYIPLRTNRTTEHGFVWLRLSDVADIAPGIHGTNWHKHIKARHWINEEWKRFENKLYLVGNRDGFWPEFGKSAYYRGHDGPAPFHAFFKELAVAGRPIPRIEIFDEEAKKVVIDPMLESAAFPSLSTNLASRGTPATENVPRSRGRANAVARNVGYSTNEASQGTPVTQNLPRTRGRANALARGIEYSKVTTRATSSADSEARTRPGLTVPCDGSTLNENAAPQFGRSVQVGSRATTAAKASWAQIARGT